MYVIIVYDVSVEKVTKLCHFLRQYLNWMQNSVFEGEVTESELESIKATIKKMINEEQDSVIIYKTTNPAFIESEQLGTPKAETSSII